MLIAINPASTGSIKPNATSPIPFKVADSVLTTARVEAEGHILKENRERMIKEDTMGDYTRTKNAIEDGVGLFGFLLKKFKK